jgi:hypothetical protein
MPGKGGFARRPEHPYRVAGLASLSDELQQLASQALPADEPASAIFVIPEQMLSRDWTGLGGIHRVPEQALIFTPHGVLHVQAGESSDGLGQVKYLPGDQLLFARLIMILVYGRIELYGAVDGNLLQISVEYNSVSQELIQPELYQLLRMAWRQVGAEKPSQNRSSSLQNSLELKSTKFASGLRSYALQQDERLLDYVFQPAIQKKKFGFSKQTIAPANLTALSDRQLIIIEEGLSSATSYGYFFTFCPCENVMRVELKTNESLKTNGRHQDVCFYLCKDGVTADHLFTLENENAQACKSLWASNCAPLTYQSIPSRS